MIRSSVPRRRRRVLPWLLGAIALAGCDSILDVDESGIITPTDLDAAGPASIASMIYAVVGAYQEAADDVARYGALITDEMVSSSNSPDRLQVDLRRIQPNNLTLTGGMYTALHQARQLADTITLVLRDREQRPEFTSVQPDIRAGIALGRLYGGYARIWLAELYCWSILTGTTPEAAPVLPDARMRQALTYLREAESLASAAGLEDSRLAAIVGQARAHLWLREYSEAAGQAGRVPRDFLYWAEYSRNAASQYNEMYTFTWGDTENIEWTVGDGVVGSRGNEEFEFLDQFIALNLVLYRPPGFTAASSSIPVVLQNLYGRPESGIRLASGAEAALIRAEAAVRASQTAAAEQILNDLRSDFSFRTLLLDRVRPPDGNALGGVRLTGTLRTDLKTVANERARELWLTGDRQTTSRRLRLDPLAINLYPALKGAVGGADDIAFPIPQLELDTNPRVVRSCPVGQALGAWR
jgi:hypothetical protein